LGIAEFFLSFLSSRRRGKFSHKILFFILIPLFLPQEIGENHQRSLYFIPLQSPQVKRLPLQGEFFIGEYSKRVVF